MADILAENAATVAGRRRIPYHTRGAYSFRAGPLETPENGQVIQMNRQGRQGSPRKCGEELNHDGMAEKRPRIKKIEPPINANKNYLRQLAFIGGSIFSGIPLALLASLAVQFYGRIKKPLREWGSNPRKGVSAGVIPRKR
jgi:hypothetical protein